YYQVIQRYSPHVIAEQFYGHTHYDEFALFYGPGAKNSQNAISTAWIGPSATPYTELNPGYRIYKVDTKSWNKNGAAFQQYWKYRGKSSGLSAACPANGPCPKEMICNLRAGKSSDSCSKISFSVKRDDEEGEEDPSGLHSLYKRAEPQPWNKKLCGLSSTL
ncbi:hypothetical protein BGW38_009969, partial [Lunasporangiospora selenospora]